MQVLKKTQFCNKSKSKSKLAQKRKWKEIDQSDKNVQNKNLYEINLKSAWKILNPSNLTYPFFICEESNSETKLRQCQAFRVHQKVK